MLLIFCFSFRYCTYTNPLDRSRFQENRKYNSEGDGYSMDDNEATAIQNSITRTVWENNPLINLAFKSKEQIARLRCAWVVERYIKDAQV